MSFGSVGVSEFSGFWGGGVGKVSDDWYGYWTHSLGGRDGCENSLTFGVCRTSHWTENHCEDGWISVLLKAGPNGASHTRIVIGNPKIASAKFPAIHRVFSLLKRTFLKSFHGAVSHKYLPNYLNEFTFRFNRRKSQSRWLLFAGLLEASALQTAPAGGFLPQADNPSLLFGHKCEKALSPSSDVFNVVRAKNLSTQAFARERYAFNRSLFPKKLTRPLRDYFCKRRQL